MREVCARLKIRNYCFLDPDNGMQISSKPFSKQHVRFSEAYSYYASHKSVIIYQHITRDKDEVRIERYLKLAEETAGSQLRVLRNRLISVRDYIFLIRPEHIPSVSKILDGFLLKSNPYFEKII